MHLSMHQHLGRFSIITLGLLCLRVFCGLLRVFCVLLRVFYGILRVFYVLLRVFYGLLRVVCWLHCPLPFCSSHGKSFLQPETIDNVVNVKYIQEISASKWLRAANCGFLYRGVRTQFSYPDDSGSTNHTGPPLDANAIVAESNRYIRVLYMM